MTRDENYEAIMAAWMNPGPQPAYHRAMQAEVHRTMPVLAAALERAALDVSRRRPVPRPAVTEDMVERAARSMSAHWHDWHTNEALGRQRALARVALDAALGTEEQS